jgi:hypothetical protein
MYEFDSGKDLDVAGFRGHVNETKGPYDLGKFLNRQDKCWVLRMGSDPGTYCNQFVTCKI